MTASRPNGGNGMWLKVVIGGMASIMMAGGLLVSAHFNKPAHSVAAVEMQGVKEELAELKTEVRADFAEAKETQRRNQAETKMAMDNIVDHLEKVITAVNGGH